MRVPYILEKRVRCGDNHESSFLGRCRCLVCLLLLLLLLVLLSRELLVYRPSAQGENLLAVAKQAAEGERQQRLRQSVRLNQSRLMCACIVPMYHTSNQFSPPLDAVDTSNDGMMAS